MYKEDCIFGDFTDDVILNIKSAVSVLHRIKLEDVTEEVVYHHVINLLKRDVNRYNYKEAAKAEKTKNKGLSLREIKPKKETETE